ncbi:MAG: hypothetical protein WC246_03190 [Candidatus Paceibacterota bacterium]|jgi:hypothetical protein
MKKRALIITALVGSVAGLVLGGAGFVHSQTAGLPFAQTMQPTSVLANSATLAGQINPNGYQTSYYFEYGTSQSLGTMTSMQSAGSGYGTIDVTGALSNLTPNIIYYFRVDAVNQLGMSRGSIFSFTTTGSDSSYGYYQQPYVYDQQPIYQESSYTYTAPVSYQTTPDASAVASPQYIYVPKYIYVNDDENANQSLSYSYNQAPVYSYPANYSVSAFMPTQYSYGYAPYSQVTPQGTQYNYNNGQLAASVAGVASPNQVAVLVGFILLVSVIVVLGALVFKH